MKRLLSIVLAALMLSSCHGTDGQKKSTRSVFAMDTYMTLTAYGDNAEAVLDDAVDKIYDLESKWSVTDTGSEIYKANNSGGRSVAVSTETSELVSYAVEMNDLTLGALDISLYPVLREWGFTSSEYKVPDDEKIKELLKNVGAKKINVSDSQLTVPDNMMIDLGSVAKGYTADLLEEELEKQGVTSALLDLGGNVQTLGKKPDGSLWKIGIRDPYSDGVIGTLEIAGKSVVTSGGYERCFTENGKNYHHILDPKTGCPAESGLVSVTVIGDEGRLCDALSTSLFVLGADDAYEIWKREHTFDYILLTDNNELLITEGIEDSFTLNKDLKVTVVRCVNQ